MEKIFFVIALFTVVKEVERNVTDTFAMSKYLFIRIQREVNECNMQIFESNEGLYLTDKKVHSTFQNQIET